MSANSLKVYDISWDALNKNKDDFNCLFNIDKETFIENCSALEQTIIKEYLPGTKELDRHKLASIIAVCASMPNVVAPQTMVNDDEVFVGKYKLALSVSLALVCDDLNADLNKAGLNDAMSKIDMVLPNPTVCTTTALDADARMLYWQEERNIDLAIRVLTLANTLFLYEELTLLSYDINMNEWISYRQEQSKNNA